MISFQLKSSFKPTGDQPQAINKLVNGVKAGLKNQVLLGVTGSGKTFTMANVIDKLQMPTLIISHNKTLAGQLYQEMRDFFPHNAVSYFVSYYDYYQPEAYIPQTDTYIEKEVEINDLIDKLRLQTTTNILTRSDVIVVASVSCIYNLGSPMEYGEYVLELAVGQKFNHDQIAYRLAQLQYDRAEFEFKRGTFRSRADYLDIYPAYEDYGFRLYHHQNIIKSIIKFDPLTGKEFKKSGHDLNTERVIIYPAKHYLTDRQTLEKVEPIIREDLKKEAQWLRENNKIVEAERLIRRVNYDLEMIREVGYVNGIENYSRYFDGRKPGEPPFTLINYFKKSFGNNFLVFIDESHMTVPQLKGMYAGDRSRKKILIEFGFRLKAAYDNRPLTFDEFYRQLNYVIYTSATPDEWEINQSKPAIVEQLIRPTGIPDPEIVIKPAKNEVTDLIKEIEIEVKKKNKILVTTLTKRIAEDLTQYLKEKNIRAEYLHSEILTLERSDILDRLREGNFDVLVGINLLREGLDLPEVALVAILDADKEGFLRSKTALIQTMGRAARNIQGKVILYADQITGSIKSAIKEIDRRRKFQLEFNRRYKITPRSIYKPVREKIISPEEVLISDNKNIPIGDDYLRSINIDSLTPYDKKKLIKKLEREMRHQASDLNFELAIKIRDKIKELKEIN